MDSNINLVKKNKIAFKKPQKFISKIGISPTSEKISLKKPANTVKNSVCNTPMNKSPAMGMSLRTSVDVADMPKKFKEQSITLRIATNNAQRETLESPNARVPNEDDLDDSQDLTPAIVKKPSGISTRKGSINDLPKMKIMNLNQKGIKLNMGKVSQL